MVDALLALVRRLARVYMQMRAYGKHAHNMINCPPGYILLISDPAERTTFESAMVRVVAKNVLGNATSEFNARLPTFHCFDLNRAERIEVSITSGSRRDRETLPGVAKVTAGNCYMLSTSGGSSSGTCGCRSAKRAGIMRVSCPT